MHNVSVSLVRCFAVAFLFSQAALAEDRFLYISSSTQGISAVSTEGTLTPFASGSFDSLAFDTEGNLYAGGVVDGPLAIFKFAPDGTPSTYATLSSSVKSLAFAPDGLLYASTMMEGISTVSTEGTLTPFASGSFDSLAFDTEGNLYASGVVDGPLAIFKFAPDGTPSTYATIDIATTGIALVPEPSTYALLLLSGAASLWALGRCKG